MEGQVFVIYSPIGGQNMDNGIMTLGLSGSTFPPGSSSGMINVRWTFPGGIVDKKYQGSGLWGYLLKPHYEEGSSIVCDEDLEKYLYENNFTDEIAQIDEINRLVRSYVTKVLMYKPSEDEYETYGWIAFQNTFDGCYDGD